MKEVTFIKITSIDGVEVEHAIIDHGNEQFTSMPKKIYEAQLAAQVEHLTGLLSAKPIKDVVK